MFRRPLLLLPLTAACLCWAPDARAQVRHCIGADGVRVYTDRKCEDLGGRELPEPPAPGGASYGMPPQRGGCARSVQDLAFSLGSALQSGDANQVAGLYDWSGMSNANAYRLMERLEAIARRPLVDVQPVYAGGTNEYGYDVVEFDEDGAPVQRKARAPRLVGLRVEQTLANGSTPSRTLFGVRKHMGCWWIRL